MKISVHPIRESERKPHVTDNKKLGFCKYFTDLMFVMQYSEVDGWHNAEIKKLQPFQMEPSTLVLHYAQEIFEGLKAYRTPKNEIQMFRPDMNAKRFIRSAARLCMPSIPENDFIESIEALIRQEQEWVPRGRGAALYIRPFMFSTDTTLGVRASSTYTYCVILSPVGPYYQEGFNPVSLYVTDELVRAAKGGLGEAKTGANYAASLLAGRVAREQGCAQVLWLDAAEHRNIEEVGAMNIFFVLDDKVVTPKLNGSILPGVTRDSVLQLARHMGLKTEERTISIDEVIGGITTGSITEIFGSGTAASISPVGSLKYKDRDYAVVNRKVGPISQKLYDMLMGVQYGDIEDPFKWIRKIEMPQEKAACAV
ncbi:MAG TPA: branched-chain amino acid aminotransferase [Candidatus Ozemobacteraceae bacterium]|nr:branched-chain amino acid aminotransferase [Candidatus Ozemobacteraceae bacterium]